MRMIKGNGYRITPITERLIRFEYNKENQFLDAPTQTILTRDLGNVFWNMEKKQGKMQVTTNFLRITYDEKPFSAAGLMVECTGNICNFGAVWRYGDKIFDLGGTARTLDGINGSCPLEPGLISRQGITVLDDSKSLILDAQGWVKPREYEQEDFYVFGYGHDYLSCIRDFYRISGNTPLLPRTVLGNWWSRYYRYSAKEYQELMQRFIAEKIPFSVAVIDMDWHVTNPPSEYGSGWTGYTWNHELFPNPQEFLEKLHALGMEVTLNDHPADGIRGFEECYERMANALGMDASSKETIKCDVTDSVFVKAWFEQVLHPLEEQGVDFWWIDWQQGQSSSMPGLDPLWMQNYLRYRDAKRDGKRGLILSRYAGYGSHRYPIGFSGDTIISWESLQFQPFFTSTASNVGFGWWSHDIGGHMQGYRDDELAGRWLQLGVFSPICRLHSSNSPFSGKEPWNYRKDICEMMKKFLRLRHRMIPYLYTMNYRCYKEGIPLILPMYYQNPEAEEAYEVEQEYYFGEQMIVVPITTPCIPEIGRASVRAWLPKGEWYDFFTGKRYRGGQYHEMYRSIDSIPVLIKTGTILPLDKECSVQAARKNPEKLQLYIYTGENCSFSLYEDENENMNYEIGKSAVTTFCWEEATKSFSILPAQGERKVLPASREYELLFQGEIPEVLRCTRDKRPLAYEMICCESNLFGIRICDISPEEKVEITVKLQKKDEEQQMLAKLYELLLEAQCEFSLKEQVYTAAKKHIKELAVQQSADFIREIAAIGLDKEFLTCILEVI